MAYITQERKKELAPKVKKVLNKFGVKGTLSITNYSTLNVKIKSGKLDLLKAENSEQMGYCMRMHEPSANHEYKCFYEELFSAIKSTGYYNNSDAMSDYFDVDFYIQIQVGQYNKPYELLIN